MAETQSTQTHPKYQYRFRFLALCATGSAIIHITAPDEHAARAMSPAGFVMVFAGRVPVRGGVEITLPSTVEKTSMEVSHV